MLLRLLLLFTIVPLVELLILLRIAEAIDWFATIMLVVVTGVLGASLARREGLKVLTRIQEDAARGIPPGDALVDGLLILVAGAVLVTPGVITDACGFALLIPPLRRFVRARLADYFKRKITVVHQGDRSGAEHPFIDVPGYGEDEDESPE